MKKLFSMLTALAVALSVAPAVTAGESDQDQAARNYFTDRTVIDQNGNPLRFYSDVLKDKVVLLNVFFTNCEQGCPLVTQMLIRTRGRLAESIRDDVWFVSVTSDPERDTPEAMKDYARRQGVDESRWLFLTGSKQDIDLILKKLKRYNPVVEMHSMQLLAGTTRERHQWVPLAPGIQPDDIAKVLRSLAEPSPG